MLGILLSFLEKAYFHVIHGGYVSFREGTVPPKSLEIDWKWTFNTLHTGNLHNPINTPAEQKNNNNARLFIYPHSWRRCSVRSAEKNVGAKTKHSKDILSGSIEVTSWKLTYPTWGKRKIIFKMDFSGDMLVPRRVHPWKKHLNAHSWKSATMEVCTSMGMNVYGLVGKMTSESWRFGIWFSIEKKSSGYQVPAKAGHLLS